MEKGKVKDITVEILITKTSHASRITLFLLVFLFSMFIYNGFLQQAWAVDVASKITDREIIESLSELKAGQKVINQRIDDLKGDLKGEIQSLRELVYVVIGGIFVLIGFVIWDRRTALAPAIRKNKELEEREDRLEKVLKEYAIEDPKLKEILKRTGLL